MEAKLWAHWVHPSFKKGQAILELAVFGSILIMLLGVLVSYGMKYNFQQRIMQQAFRKALVSAAESRQSNKPTSVSHIVIEDRHISSPSNAFAVGSVSPIIASASVTRTYELQATPDPNKENELPQLSLNINGEIYTFKTSAFRDVYNVLVGHLEKDYDSDASGTIDTDEKDRSRYDYIYGSENVGWWTKDGADGEGQCAGPMEEEEDPDNPGETIRTCPDAYKTKNIRILDDCAGEVMDYDSIQKRCYRIYKAGITRPWYCGEDYKPLASLFAFAAEYGYSTISDLSALPDENKPKMGLQQNYTQQISSYGDTSLPSNNTLTEIESASDITTTDTLNWQVDTKRTTVYYDGLKDGFSQGWKESYIIGDAEGEGEITTSVGQNKTSTWKTNW